MMGLRWYIHVFYMSKKKKQLNDAEIVIYKDRDRGVVVEADIHDETIWLTQEQIATLFGTQRPAIGKHLGNIFKSAELSKNSVCSILEHTASDGKKYRKQFYNLDAIIAVGYRVNSKQATQFRIWATKVLKDHLVQGYTINRSRIAKNYDVFLKAVEQVKKLLPAGGEVDAQSALELMKLFANTWVSLDAYDKSVLPKNGATKKQVTIAAGDLENALGHMKQEMIAKNIASNLFGQERQKDSVAGIVGNVFQSFGGHDLYPSVEEKAAHLLYFMVKNHPFADGNKRSGAFAFVWFLNKARLLNTSRMTAEALTALTLLVAESNPRDKDRMVGLVLLLLKK